MNKIFSKIKDIVGISFFDSIYKTLSFHDFFIATFPSCLKREIKRNERQRDKVAATLKKKEKIVVAFFLQSPSVWKYDRLYRLLETLQPYEPIVVVCPFNVHLNYDRTETLKVMKKSEAFVQANHYRYISGYNEQTNKWRNIKKEINPDIIFYTKPYKDTLPAFHIYNFKDKLNCYAPYGIGCVDLYRINYNIPFNNLLWKFFVETTFQQGFAQKYALGKGENTEVVGSLGMETILLKDYQPKDVWKPQPQRKKRIIWAPHHTVDYLFNFSNFFTYCEFMFDMAEKYQDQIQIAFKPHPILKFKLINIWGEERTETYYKKWSDLSNGQLEDGYYIDLFMTSDAMIHDCASFTAEYLYTGKPTMFIIKDHTTGEHWNDFGKICFDLHYQAHNENDIESFIKNVIIDGDDVKMAERKAFFDRYLYPKDGIMPSQKIIDILNKKIWAS